MRFVASSVLTILLLSVGAAYTPAQEADDDTSTRSWFVEKSRPKKKTKARTHRAKSAAASKASVKTEPAAGPATEAPAVTASPAHHTTVAAEGRIGLGVTLFKRGENEAPVVADPRAEFAAADQLRLQLEPSVDGYVYVFAAENGRNPQMLFPDVRLDGGLNDIEAHTAVEIPSRHQPKHRWFEFTGGAATEQVYLVVSREPLPGVPTGDELARYCKTFGCPWKPSEQVWSWIERIARQAAATEVVARVGRQQSRAEEEALTREIVLSAEDAEPTTVVALDGGVAIATVVEIRHR